MSEFKIRTIHDKVNERKTCIIGIDRFDDIDPYHRDNGNDYYCAALVLDASGNPITNPKPYFGRGGSFGNKNGTGMTIHLDDEFNLPNPLMYSLLGEALKRGGYVYNKKKCRFQKINNEDED